MRGAGSTGLAWMARFHAASAASGFPASSSLRASRISSDVVVGIEGGGALQVWKIVILQREVVAHLIDRAPGE